MKNRRRRMKGITAKAMKVLEMETVLVNQGRQVHQEVARSRVMERVIRHRQATEMRMAMVGRAMVRSRLGMAPMKEHPSLVEITRITGKHHRYLEPLLNHQLPTRTTHHKIARNGYVG